MTVYYTACLKTDELHCNSQMSHKVLWMVHNVTANLVFCCICTMVAFPTIVSCVSISHSPYPWACPPMGHQPPPPCPPMGQMPCPPMGQMPCPHFHPGPPMGPPPPLPRHWMQRREESLPPRPSATVRRQLERIQRKNRAKRAKRRVREKALIVAGRAALAQASGGGGSPSSASEAAGRALDGVVDAVESIDLDPAQ